MPSGVGKTLVPTGSAYSAMTRESYRSAKLSARRSCSMLPHCRRIETTDSATSLSNSPLQTVSFLDLGVSVTMRCNHPGSLDITPVSNTLHRDSPVQASMRNACSIFLWTTLDLRLYLRAKRLNGAPTHELSCPSCHNYFTSVPRFYCSLLLTTPTQCLVK